MLLRYTASLLAILFLYTACRHSSANINLKNEKEVRQVLATTWEAAYMETRGSRIKVPEAHINHITYHNNGSYTVKLKDGMIETKGNWQYDSKTAMLNITQGSNMGQERLHKLTSNEMVVAGFTILNDVIVDSVIVTYKKQ